MKLHQEDKEGQAKSMLICAGEDVLPAEVGHWYSPSAVAEFILVEREACATICDDMLVGGHYESVLNDGLERALLPTGYLCLYEGGYNHDEVPKFSITNIAAGLPNDLSRCWPIYDLAAVVKAVELVRPT